MSMTPTSRARGADGDIGQTSGAWRRRKHEDDRIIEGHARGSVATTRTKVRIYLDSDLSDFLLHTSRITHRQHEAAARLKKLWTSAGLNPHVVAGMDVVHDEIHEPPDGNEPREDTRAPDDPTPRDRYRSIMRRAGTAHAMRLDALMLGQYPGREWMATLQGALDWLGDWWGLEKGKP